MTLPRSRSDAPLREAVVRLASRKPADTTNVSELCREAGITRDTFYRHASSPIVLLARVLNDDLGAYDELTQVLPEDPLGATVMHAPSRAWLQHVRRFEVVYRTALRPHLPMELRDVLHCHIDRFMRTHAGRNPGILPVVEGRPLTGRAVDLAAAYAASGAVGAIESWLSTGAIGDLDALTGFIHASTAAWWFTPVPTVR